MSTIDNRISDLEAIRSLLDEQITALRFERVAGQALPQPQARTDVPDVSAPHGTKRCVTPRMSAAARSAWAMAIMRSRLWVVPLDWTRSQVQYRADDKVAQSMAAKLAQECRDLLAEGKVERRVARLFQGRPMYEYRLKDEFRV